MINVNDIQEILENNRCFQEQIERLKQGYCELKEKCNKGECDCTHEEYNGMCEENIRLENEINRLKEEYVMLQNASDEVEDKLQARIDKVTDYIKDVLNSTWIDERECLKRALKIIQGSDKE